MEGRDSTFQLSSGDTLGYAEFGNTSGTPVLYFHGLPGSRSEGLLWHKAAANSKVRLIAPDRPGLGLSTRDRTRQLNDYPKDMLELLNHLDVQAVMVIGVSGGGPYALACAASPDLSHRIKSVAVVAGLPDPEIPKTGMNVMQRFAYFAINTLPSSLIGWFWEQLIGKTARGSDPETLRKLVKQSLKASGGQDAEFADDDDIVGGTAESLRGAFAQGSGGYVQDAAIVSRVWGFRLEDIGVPVGFWCGGKDTLAPPGMGQIMSKTVQKGIWKCYEADSHTGVVLRHQEEVLGWLVDQK